MLAAGARRRAATAATRRIRSAIAAVQVAGLIKGFMRYPLVWVMTAEPTVQ